MKDLFRKFANKTSELTGSVWGFIAATLIIVLWAVSGPFFGFSSDWQLYINTLTTLVTFLMVFLIQNTQNRDAKAIQLKLDELLRGVTDARTSMVDLEDSTDEELQQQKQEFQRLGERERSNGQTLKSTDDQDEHIPSGSETNAQRASH